MRLFLFVFFLLAFSAPLSAEYYRYVDNQGVVYFTDNLAEVPTDQRSQENSFNEIKSVQNSDDTKKMISAQTDQPGKEASASNQDPSEGEVNNLSQIQLLNKEKETLDQTYESLVRRKQALKKEEASAGTSKTKKIVQDKVNTLNQEIQDFEKLRKAFVIRAKAFNAQASQ